MVFLETPRFPDEISEGASGGPSFRTHVFETTTGLEQRHAQWTRAKHRYDFSLGIRDTADMETARQFFVAIRGRANSFRYKDWNDFELVDELIGEGDGTTTEFQITKTYTTGSYTYVRNIRKPVDGIQVYVNDVLQVLTTDYTIDTTTGIITFVSPPTSTHEINVTGEFDVPVRFDVDAMDASHVGYQSEDWGGVKLVEDLTV